jgi:hypothetical protein
MTTALARLQSPGLSSVGTPKSFAFAVPVNNKKALHHRNVDAYQTILNYWHLSQMPWTMVKRVET